MYFSAFTTNEIFGELTKSEIFPILLAVLPLDFKMRLFGKKLKKKGDAAIKKMIDDALYNTSVTVVFIGNQTANRAYIKYEIEQSIARGNAVIGVQIHHLKNQKQETDAPGNTPKLLVENGFKVYKYTDYEQLATKIEEAAKLAGK